MPVKPLDECRATLDRVDTKLDYLSTCIESYQRNSYDIIIDDNLNEGERLYCLAKVVPPPLDISIDVTEITCLMRSALDHLMFQLVAASNDGAIPDDIAKNVYFPIADKEDTFDNKGNLKKWGISSNVSSWLISLQLFGQSEIEQRPLLSLNSLVNTSKHRFHSKIIGVIPSVESEIGGSGFSNCNCVDCSVQTSINGKVVSHFFRTSHPLTPDLVEGAAVFRFVPGREGDPSSLSDDDISIPFHQQDYLDRMKKSFASIQGTKWTRKEWDLYFQDFVIDVDISQQLQFAQENGPLAGLPVFDTLQSIQSFLRNRVFVSSGVLAGM